MTQTSTTLALAGFSFMMTVIWGPPLLRVLRYYKVGKSIRVEGPERHYTKLGTPTMGGVLIIVPVLFITILLNAASLIGISVTGRSIMLPLAVMVAYGALGAIDDWEGLRSKRSALGMRGRVKFVFQVVIAVIV
ncbi:MAG: phospho-N-acetylmuramoyl-pentapeptide-transferase, partial [Anaerolineales bacterium]